MRAKLPTLTKKRLRWLLDHAYDEVTADLFKERASSPEENLLLIVKLMQQANLTYRANDCVALFPLFSGQDFLEPNSEGTTTFLAMALAIKELFAIEEEDLKRLVFACY